MDPGGKTGGPAKSSQPPVGLDEDLLGRVARVAQRPEAKTADPRLVLPDKEGVGLRIPGTDPIDDQPVFILHDALF